MRPTEAEECLVAHEGGLVLDAERWQQVRETLEKLFEVAPADRLSELERLCAGDSELRSEVASLLEADTRGTLIDGRLARLPGVVSKAFDEPPDADPLVGLVIDRYRLLRRIGRGGMGSVYLAERADNMYQHRVALKLIHDCEGEDLAMRLRNERQFLAGLDHPNIARLLDGGQATGEGIPEAILGCPYMVMELVEGTRLDIYADERRLTIAERLLLFRDVCGAVQYAHRNMVVHRDLKPANIMVRHDGTVKLLDFGIAKALNPTLSSVSMRETRSDLRVLSPSYASPEQLLGGTVGEASDVYSLGVVLFRLLTGRVPYGDDHSLQRTITAILDGVIESPSTAVARAKSEGADEVPIEDVAARRRTTPKELESTLRGELDAMVLRTLARNPRDRYECPSALSDDIKRWLEGLPIAAFRPGIVLRLRRLATRHPLAVTFSTLGSAALIASSLITAQQARVAAHARDQAERKAAAAAEISEFMVGVFEGATPATGSSITARALLDQAAEQIDGELEGLPESQVSLRQAIGRAYESLGIFDAAKVQLEAALALRRRLPNTTAQELAASERFLGSLLLELGEPARAATLFEDSLAHLEAEGQPHPEAIIEGKAFLSYAMGMLGHDADAEALRRERLEMAESRFGRTHRSVGQALNDLGQILIKRGKPAEAELFLRRALALRCRAGVASRACAGTSRHLADALREIDRLDEAETVARAAMGMAEEVLGKEHPGLGTSMFVVAQVLTAQGVLDEAASLAQLGLEQHMAGQEVGQTLTVIMHSLGAEIALASGRPDEAMERLAVATELMYRVTPPKHVTRLEVRALRGRCLLALGRIEEGRRELQSAVEALRTRAPGSSALRLADAALGPLGSEGK